MIFRLFTAFVLSLFAFSAAAQGSLRLAVTTSFHNSGLADVLLPKIREELDLEVHLLVVGTGQALKLGRAGDVDAILVHSRAAEDEFVKNGYGPHRREIMYNDFVVVGPKADPASVSSAQTAAESLLLIAGAEVAFVSRGDDSGTHKKELSLWRAAGLMPKGRWYNSVGAGMGAALNTGIGLDAYVLSDRASWLNFGNKGDHVVLFSGDPELFNQYAFLPVSLTRHPHVKAKQAARLEEWLTSNRAAELINNYHIDGEALFIFNAR